MLWSALSALVQLLLPSMLVLSLTSSAPTVCPGQPFHFQRSSDLLNPGWHSVVSAGWTSEAFRLARWENSSFQSYISCSSEFGEATPIRREDGGGGGEVEGEEEGPWY